MSPWWYEHCKRYSTVDALLGPDSMAKITAQAEFAEIENIVTETRNANIRRMVFNAVQCRRSVLHDISAMWVISTEKGEEAGPWFDAWEFEEQKTKRGKKPRAGGGGTFRAFVNRVHKDCRLDNGRLDFAAIIRRWREERDKDESVLLKECAEAGVAATRAHHDLQHGLDRRDSRPKQNVSSFGTVQARAPKKAERQSRSQAMLDDYNLHALNLERDQDAGNAIVPVSGQSTFGELVALRSPKMEEQLDFISRLSHVVASQRAREQRRVEEEFRSALRNDNRVANVDLTKARLPCDVAVRGVRGGAGMAVVKPVFGCLKWASYKISEILSSRKNLKDTRLKLWSTEHEMVSVEKAPGIESVPAGFRKTPCWEHGHGRCLCTRCVK